MRCKDYDVWLRWRPHLTRRQLRRLRSELRTCDAELSVAVDGINGSSKWPRPVDLKRILATVRAVRGTIDDVHGAIVPRGYGWQPVLEANFGGRGWRAWLASRSICDDLPLVRGIGHTQGCECHKMGRYNTDACIVAEDWAQTPPLVVLPEGE